MVRRRPWARSPAREDAVRTAEARADDLAQGLRRTIEAQRDALERLELEKDSDLRQCRAAFECERDELRDTIAALRRRLEETA